MVYRIGYGIILLIYLKCEVETHGVTIKRTVQASLRTEDLISCHWFVARNMERLVGFCF